MPAPVIARKRAKLQKLHATAESATPQEIDREGQIEHPPPPEPVCEPAEDQRPSTRR